MLMTLGTSKQKTQKKLGPRDLDGGGRDKIRGFWKTPPKRVKTMTKISFQGVKKWNKGG